MNITEDKGSASDFSVETAPPVLFFDGECGLCNNSIRWLIDHDRRRVLRFAPLRPIITTGRWFCGTKTAFTSNLTPLCERLPVSVASGGLRAYSWRCHG